MSDVVRHINELATMQIKNTDSNGTNRTNND